MSRAFFGPPCRAAACRLVAPLVVVWLAAVGVRAQLVINEILPDPDGSDAGHEFVELINTGDIDVGLAGWQLQFANGAEGPIWQTRWSGQAPQFIAPGARYLIVDRNWPGPAVADAEVSLALQNGPDAIRLVNDGQVADLVGYGALTDTLMMETAAVAVVPGRSLARRPDGRDTGNNREDLVAAAPSPGAANFALRSLRLVQWSAEPPSATTPGQALVIAATLRNDGVESLPTARVLLTCGVDTIAATLDATSGGEERELTWIARPSANGALPLRLLCGLRDPVDTLRVDLGHLQVGPGALRLSEVMPAPGGGEGEWLELVAIGPEPVEVGDFRLRDEDGDPVPLPPLRLEPNRRAIACQDSLALTDWLARHEAGPGSARGCEASLRQLRPWPTLNNSAPAGRAFADRVHLAALDGTVVDHVVVGPSGTEVPVGRSWERLDPTAGGPGRDGWTVCLAQAGATPGCANSVEASVSAAPGGTALLAEPAAADRAAGQAAIHLRFVVPPGAEGWDLRVFDLDGRQVRDLGGDTQGAGPRAVHWDLRADDGSAIGAGGYIASLRLRGRVPAGGRARQLLVVR